MDIFGKSFLVAIIFALGCMCVSCSGKKDDNFVGKPKITVDYNDGIVLQNGTIVTGTIVSASPLTVVTFSYVKDGTIDVFSTITTFDNSSSYEIKQTLTNVTADITAIKISATNKDGEVTEITLPKAAETALSSPVSFGLGHPTENPMGLPNTAYGITYYANTNATEAVFSGAFIMLTKEGYDITTSKNHLVSGYETDSKTLGFTAKFDSEFSPKYFISSNASEYYLIEMTGLTNGMASFTVRQ